MDTAQLSASLWLPIESAPVDDTLILVSLWANNEPDGTRRCSIAHRFGVDDYWTDDAGNEIYPPTHWMPLPQSPEHGRK